MTHRSVKFRITLWYTLAMMLVSAITLFAMISFSRTMMENTAAERLQSAVTDLAARRFFRREAEPAPRPSKESDDAVPPPMPNNTANREFDLNQKIPGFVFYDKGVHMALFNRQGESLAGNLPFAFTADTNPDFQGNSLQKITFEGNRYLVYDLQTPPREQGEQFWIRGVISLSDENGALNSIIKTNLILTLILILAVAIGGYLMLSRAFSPVAKISATAKEIIENGDLSRRIGTPGRGDEISRMVNAFDTMLDKIETIVAREKQFTSDASHELRTPIAVITSECEYMLECAKTEDEFKESAAVIKRQSDRMSKLISELLTLSRMDCNTQAVTMEDFDISELLSFVCDEQIDLHDGTICLKKEIQPNITVHADRFLLARLFINLIQNAYRYSKETGTITVSLKTENQKLIASVADDGIGISEEDLPKIWERFYQADASRNNGDSMGLGLSMVAWIAKCHGGEMTVESTLSQGSVFTFTMNL